jgi:uncharacterized protein YjbI with pentapeptide repeats
MEAYHEGETFTGLDSPLPPGEYEDCTFENCVFENLSSHTFIDCAFNQCNLSNVNIQGTTLNNVHFHKCKVVGVRFDTCNEFIFSVSFSDSNLHLCSFYGRNIQSTQFNSCDLSEADFATSDCSSVNFEDCNLQNAIFENTKLVKTNFHTAENLRLDPDNNFLQKCIFSPQSALGLLYKYDILIK